MSGRLWTAASAMLAAVVIGGCEGSGPEQTGGTFVLMPVATFGLDTGAGALSSVPVMSAPIGGTYHVVTTPYGRGRELPRVFDVGGRYVSTLGSFGAGPEEYGTAEMVYASGDTALIHDRELKRMSFFVAPSTVVREVPWTERPYTMIELADGSFVQSPGNFDPRPPMLHVSRDGRVLREFGDAPIDANIEPRYRVLARDPAGGFWSARGSLSYELQHWTAPGELQATYQLVAPWFPREPQRTQHSPSQPPSSFVRDMWVDSLGMLWIVSATSDEQWYEALGPAEQVEGSTYFPVLDPDKFYDTMIERWDPKAKAVVFSERLDAYYGVSAGPWLLGHQTENGDGFVKVELVRVVPR